MTILYNYIYYVVYVIFTFITKYAAPASFTGTFVTIYSLGVYAMPTFTTFATN